MAEYDFIVEQGARELARRIVAYWVARGCKVVVRVEKVEAGQHEIGGLLRGDYSSGGRVYPSWGWFTSRGNMIGSPRQLYVVDVYHQPPGYAQPVVKEQHRIIARSDAEGISEAQGIFAGRDMPLVTGFALRAIGSRRFRDQAIYRHDKAAEAPAFKNAAD
jgi:hypothetical protein